MPTVWFETPHGSRLYGTHHATSDHDTYRVIDEPRVLSPEVRRITQIVAEHPNADGIVTDVTVAGVNTWLAQCAAGIPQALEVMFAPATPSDLITAFRAGYRVNPYPMCATYLRAINDHAVRAPHRPNPVKHRAHAVRMALNLHTGLTTGRFSPVLTEDEKATMRRVSTADNFEALLDGLLARDGLTRV